MTLIELVRQNPQFQGNRRISLYSDFRKLKVANIDGYEANVVAWSTLLLEALEKQSFEHSVVIPTGKKLLDDLFDPSTGRPLSLDVVLDEMVANRTAIPLSQYTQFSHSIYDANWRHPSIRGVLSWSLTRSGLWDMSWRSWTGTAGTLRNESYVNVKRLESIADSVWEALESKLQLSVSYSQGVFTRDLLVDAITSLRIKLPRSQSPVALSSTDIDCLLIFLSRDHQKFVTDGSVYKIRHNSDDTITQKDIAVASLKSTIHQVSERVDALSDQITAHTSKAKRAVDLKHNAVAKYALKSRRMAQTSQETALGMLENLQHVLSKIDEASDQIEIVNALSSGAEILGQLNATIGGAEKVGDLMDQIREQVQDTDEVAREISSLTSSAVDEGELDRELDEMLEAEQKSALDKLEPVPQTPLPKVREDELNDLSDQMDHVHIAKEPTLAS